MYSLAFQASSVRSKLLRSEWGERYRTEVGTRRDDRSRGKLRNFMPALLRHRFHWATWAHAVNLRWWPIPSLPVMQWCLSFPLRWRWPWSSTWPCWFCTFCWAVPSRAWSSFWWDWLSPAWRAGWSLYRYLCTNYGAEIDIVYSVGLRRDVVPALLAASAPAWHWGFVGGG